MPMTIRPFAAADLPIAARLAAARHRDRRRTHPALPARFEEPQPMLELLAAAWAVPGATGAVAVVDGTTRAFLLALPARGRPQATYVPAFGIAVAPGLSPAVPPALQDALLPAWRAAGQREHHLTLDVDDPALAAWRERGVREILTLAVGATSCFDGLPEPGSIRLAEPSDLPIVLALIAALRAHHTALGDDLGHVDGLAEAARQHDMLSDPRSGCWLAIRDGAAVGMVTVRPPDASISPLHRPHATVHLTDAVTLPAARGLGIGAALVAAALGWCRAIGYGTCVLHWHPANPGAARFWKRLGFRPIAHQIVRRD